MNHTLSSLIPSMQILTVNLISELIRQDEEFKNQAPVPAVPTQTAE